MGVRGVPAPPQRGALGQGVGEACSQPQHQHVALPQVADPLLLDAHITQLRQVQHDWDRERERERNQLLDLRLWLLESGHLWRDPLFSWPFLHSVST